MNSIHVLHIDLFFCKTNAKSDHPVVSFLEK